MNESHILTEKEQKEEPSYIICPFSTKHISTKTKKRKQKTQTRKRLRGHFTDLTPIRATQS